jgi:hypothetical protein
MTCGGHIPFLRLPSHRVHYRTLIGILLLDLLHLFVDLLPALGIVPVVQEDGAGVLNHLELCAHDSETSLDEPILMRRALVLLLPGVGDVLVWRKGVVFQYLGVFFDDGHVRLELG